MHTKIIRIGNSQGIRIPKPLLVQSGLGEEVEIEAESGRIVIRAASHPRQGWADAFRSMAAHGDDGLLDGAANPSGWNEVERSPRHGA